MTTSSRSRPAVLCAMVLGVISLAASLAFAVPSTSAASGPANPEASELVRLINGVRAANGLSALRLDPTLAGLARDTKIACPTNSSLVMAGRARDGADYSWAKHQLRLCPTVIFVDLLVSTYRYGSAGEIMLQNRGYGTGEYSLSYQGSRSTFTTNTYSTTGNGILGWMGSPYHRPIILGAYDRVGCGGWLAADNTFWYDCEFSKGGPNGTTSPPTRSPFGGPAATAKPVPVPVPVPTARRTNCPTPAATTRSTVTSGSQAGAGVKPTPDPATPSPVASAAPTDQVLGADSSAAAAAAPSGALLGVEAKDQGAGGGAVNTSRTTNAPTPSSTSMGLATAIMAIFTAGYGLFLAIRKRRRRVMAQA